MIFCHWQHDIRWYIFSNDTCFSKTVLVYLHYFHMMYQSTSSSEYFFFSFFSGFFTYQLHNYLTSTYQLHRHYSSLSSLSINLISLSFEPWIFWQLPSCFHFFIVFWMLWILVTVYMIKDIDNIYCIRHVNK